MKQTFQEVKVKAVKRWVDVNGKKRQQTKTFMQTINPFNRDDEGRIKTYSQISKELSTMADAWMKEPPEETV